MDWAEASMRNLTSLVQEVLKTNINMASRMKNLERMHLACNPSMNASQDDVPDREASKSRATSRTTCSRSGFEKELETSTVYKRTAVNQLRFSKSSNSSNGPSYLSGLSLSDVSNVSAIALPISPMELWNHHRYARNAPGYTMARTTSLEAWYNPPAKVKPITLFLVLDADRVIRKVRLSGPLTSMASTQISTRSQSSQGISFIDASP